MSAQPASSGILSHLKGLWAAAFPLYQIYAAASSDGSISSNEYGDIGKALVVFAGVWLIPNIGYVRTTFLSRNKEQAPAEDQTQA